MPTTAELRDQITERVTKARDIAALAEKENRDFTDTERVQITGYMTEAKDMKGSLLKAEGDADLRAQLTALGVGLIDRQGGTTTGRPTPVLLPPTNRRQSLGQQFLESPEYRDFMAQYGRTGLIPDSAKGLQSRPAFFNALLTGASETSAGALVVPDDTQIVAPYPRQALTLRQIVTNGTTTSDTVEFVRVTAETSAAAPVAEATATSGGSGLKPESTLTLARITEPVTTVAHWIPATKRAISDAGQLRTLIDSFLRYGLELELEDQIINGDGIGEHFTGILATVGIQTQAFDTDILTTLRKARTLVSVVGGDMPSAYLMNPYDWQTIDLLQDNENRYFFGGPQAVGLPRLWGLPVVESQSIAQGTAICANFRQSILWDRQEATITMSDSHDTFFVHNLLAILAELRAVYAVIRPKSFVSAATAA